ncbi:hypothetical protein FACS189425_10180 [Clostridia bacterium]|nr:hypothetical protein FACS189425_10180 [Clostridia bacterium]
MKRKWWLIPVAFIAALALTLFVLFKVNVQLPDKPWEPSPSPTPATGTSVGVPVTPSPPPTGVHVDSNRKEGVYTFLLIGTDKGSALTDTLIVASLNIKEHKLALISIPRDTYIPGAERGVKKINGAYGGKHMDRLLDEVSLVVGFRPDYTAMVHLEGFIALVDAIGGVDFDVPQRLYYRDPAQGLYIDVQKGFQHLDGEHALQVARFRRGYVTQDLQRTEVQRGLLKAIAKKVLSPSGLTKLPALADVVADNLITELTWGQMTALALEAAKVDMENDAIFGIIPVKALTLNGASYVEVLKEEAVELINRSINPYKEDITVEHILP